MQINRNEHKIDLSHLYYQRDKAIITKFINMPETQMLLSLQSEIADPKSPVLRVTDTQVVLSFKKSLFKILDEYSILMKNATMKGQEYDTTNLSRLIRIIRKLLNEDVYLAQESLNYHKYLQLLIYSPNHSLIADVFEIIGKTSFDKSKTICFYYILSYIQHWNNHNDRHWTLVDLGHIHPDFVFEFVKNQQIISIQRQADLKSAYPGLNFMQITMKIIEEEKLNLTLDQFLTHQLLCKVRLALCPPDQKQEAVRGVLSAIRLFCFIDLMWYRTLPSVIPNIFEMPPNYVEMFKQILELFLTPQCSLKNRIIILDMLKVIVNYEMRNGQSHILVSLLQNYILLQNFLIDMKNFVQKKKTKYIPESDFQNTEFVLKILKLFDNLQTGLILDSTSEILEGLFYSEDADSKIIQEAGILIINGFLQENNQSQLIDFIFKQISKGQSQHIKVYIAMLTELLSQDVRQRVTQRRDSTALARTITESQIFQTLIKLIRPPFDSESIGMRTINLLTTICCESPLLTDKLAIPIGHILDNLKTIDNYPTDGQNIESIIQFFHYISLKEGPIRQRILNQNFIQEYMNIFIQNRFSQALMSKHLTSILSTINRFRSNVFLSKIHFFNGTLRAFEQTVLSAQAYEFYMDKILVNDIVLKQPIKYEQLNARIIALFKLYKKIGNTQDFLLPSASFAFLNKYLNSLFAFKYLNIQNPSDNKQTTKSLYLSANTDTEKVMLEKINFAVKPPLQFLEDQKKINPELQHIFTASFFEMLERSKNQPSYKNYLINYTNSCAVQKIFQKQSMHLSIFSPATLFQKSLAFMKILPELDKIRSAEDVFCLNRRITKIKKPYKNQKEKLDHLKHHLKAISQKNGPFSLLHQTLRKLIIFSHQTRNYEVLQQYSKIIINDISNLNSFELSTSIQCLYLIKLKVQNLQYILNTINPNNNQKNFPMQFSAFVLFYQATPMTILAPLVRIAKFYYCQPCQDQLSETWIFRIEVMLKILAVIHSLITFHEDSLEYQVQEEQQAHIQMQRIDAFNYVVYTLQKDLIECTRSLPRQTMNTKPELQQVMSKIIQEIVKTVRYIQDVITDDNIYLVRPLINFTVEQDKKMTKKQLCSETKEIYQKFKGYVSESLENFAICPEEYINVLCQNAFNERLKLYQRKRSLTDFFNLVSTKILKTSKQLFQNFVLDLGVKHPKNSIKLQETNPKQCIINTEILIDSITTVLQKLIHENWFGEGQLEVTPHYTSEIVRFVTKIIIDCKSIEQNGSIGVFDPINDLISKCLKFIWTSEKYLLTQIKFKDQKKIEETKGQFKSKLAQKTEKMQKKQTNLNKVKGKQSKQSSKQQTLQIHTPVRHRKGGKKKNKIKKLWELNSRISHFIESVVGQSAKNPLMKSTTFQSILQYIQIKLGKGQSIVEQAKFDFKKLNIFEVQLLDNEKTGLLILTIQMVMKLLPSSHHKVDIEAIIKRVFFENDPKTTSTKISFSSIQSLEKMWENREQFIKVVKKICIITKKNQQISPPVPYNTALQDIQNYNISLKPSVDYITISTKIKKVKKSHKKSMSKEDSGAEDNKSTKYIDYIPDGEVHQFLKQLIDFTIQRIIKEAVIHSESQQYKSKLAFNSVIGICSILTIIRVWPTLIPFISRYRCKKILLTMSPFLQKLSILTGHSLKFQQTDMTLIGFLIRVATPLIFDKVHALMCEMCADNYILVQSHRDVVIPLGHYIRTKVIKELSLFNISQNSTKTISYLSLLSNLLKLKQFSVLALQQGIVQVLHQEVINLQKQQYNRDAYIRFLQFFTLPLTILHVVNLHMQISKFKPIEIRGKTNNLRDQYIPANQFKRNKFSSNWFYNNPQNDNENQNPDEMEDLPAFVDGEGRSYLAVSEQDESSQQNSDELSDISINQSDVFINNQIVQQMQEQEGISRGWTSNMGDDQSMGFDDDFQNQLQQIPEVEEEMGIDGDEYYSDDIDIDDMESEQIMTQLYGDGGAIFEDLSQSGRSINLRDIHQIITNILSIESQGQLQSLLVKLMYKINNFLRNSQNPLALAIKQDSPSGKLLKVAKNLYKFLATNMDHMEDLPKNNISQHTSVIHRRLLYDDSQGISNRFIRRNGELLRYNNQIVIHINNGNPTIQIPSSIVNQVEIQQLQQPQQIIQNQQEESPNLNRHAENQPHIRERNYTLQSSQILGSPLEEQGLDQENQDDAVENVESIVEQDENLFEDVDENQNQEEFAEGNNQLLLLSNLTDDKIRELLHQHQFDQDYFYSLDPQGRDQIIQNMLGMVQINNNMEEQKANNSESQNDNELQVVRRETSRIQQEIPETGRRKISIQYHKKIQRDPKEIISKQKKQNKIYICQNEFLMTILNILYFDPFDFSNFPYPMLKALCTNSVNQSKVLSCLMIILKHPNLKNQKALHNESSSQFPKTILVQRNNQIITDYERQGYHQVCEKILYILSHLSKTNPNGMLLSKHNKVDFLPSWYHIEELPYYKHLIQLIKTPHFKNNKLLGELTDVLFNIVNHHSMKYIHALQHKQEVQFQMRLSKEDIELLCFLLYGEYSQTKSDEVIKNIVLLLCVDDYNLRMFINTFEQVVDSLSQKSIKLLNNQISQQYTNEDKLHNVLRIVASMFEDQYQTKVQKKDSQKNKIKEQVLKQFKRVLECPSLISLFKLCSQLAMEYPKKINHLQRIQVIMFSFFIIYNIVLIQEEQQQKTNSISKMEELNAIKKTSVNGPLFGLEVEKALGQVFNSMKNNAKPMINHLLKQILNNLKKSHHSKEHSSIFNEPIIRVLSKHHTLIQYENKRAMFKAQIKNLRKNKHTDEIDISVNRQNVLLSSMNKVMAMNSNQLHDKFHITFENQEGEDAGGLTREWFMLLSKQIFNPHYALFQPSSTGNTYQPSPKSYVNPNHLQFFKFIGRVVGKALHDGYLLDAYFTPAFYKHILGKPLSWKDLEQEDYQFYQSINWLLNNDVTDMCLTFSYEDEYFGDIQTKDLIPNGRDIAVTEDNKIQYVQRRCYARMATAVQKQIQNFLIGFHELIPHQTVSIFEPKQLELMISGLPTIDIQDLKENTQYVNYEKTDNVIIWLFQVLQSFDNSLRASFIQFVTGTSRVPSQGFKSLRGVNGPQKFNIQKQFSVQKLPRAHTCFNQLDLPDYPSKDVLIQKLTLAITQGREGFGFI